MKLKFQVFLCILSVFILSGIFLPIVHGQTAAYRGLIIDEVKFDIKNAVKGEVYNESFSVTHDFENKDRKVILNLKAKNFTSDGKTGNPILITGEEIPQASNLASWITFEKDQIELDHYGQVEKINFSINVPENAEPGGKYAMVILSDAPDSLSNGEDSAVGVTREIGPLVLITVEGETKQELKVNSIKTSNILGATKNIYFNPPINIVTDIQNLGNIHSVPRGSIFIYQGNDFQKYVSKIDLNDDKGAVLPNTARQFVNTWNDSFINFEKVQVIDKSGVAKTEVKTIYDWDKLSKLRIGKFNVKLLYTPDSNNNRTIEMQTSFWLIPWQIIAAILALIAIIFSIIITIKLAIKSAIAKNLKAENKK